MGGGKIKRNFVVAHPLEARSIIDFYGLSKNLDSQGFDVFEKDEVRLVVSGQGKVACAAAVGYCSGLTTQPNDPALWINIGISGHRYHPIGELFRANKIIDSLSQTCYFPGNLLRTSNIFGAAVMTVDEPENQYQQDCLYDMEVSAFFSTALRMASIEYINSFKIISDNQDNSIVNIKAKEAQSMIASQIVRIDQYLYDLEENLSNNLNKSIQPNEFKEKINSRLHLTHSQREQVESLINSLSIHGAEFEDDLLKLSKAEELIELLNDKLTKIQLVV